MRITAQAMGEFVRSLENRGFITRANADSAGRAILLELTAEGKALYRRCRSLIIRSERDFLATLPEADRERFVANLVLLGAVKDDE
jgi:DNA-binding MarR family transcriptional regulator